MSDEKKYLQKCSSIFDKILSVLMTLGACILAFLMFSVCWDVVARTIASKPLTWVLEITEYGLLFITFLCTPWVLKNEGHVISDLLLVTLSSKNQAFLNMITSLLGSFICGILTWIGAQVCWEKYQSGAFQPTAIQPPDFPIFIIIPLGFFLLLIQFLRRINHNYQGWRE